MLKDGYIGFRMLRSVFKVGPQELGMLEQPSIEFRFACERTLGFDLGHGGWVMRKLGYDAVLRHVR